MGASFKGIRGGTPTGEPLCTTCRNAVRRRGASESDVQIFCNSAPGHGNQKLTTLAMECSAYDDVRIPSRWDMEQIAWILKSDSVTKKIGFEAPKRSNLPYED